MKLVVNPIFIFLVLRKENFEIDYLQTDPPLKNWLIYKKSWKNRSRSNVFFKMYVVPQERRRLENPNKGKKEEYLRGIYINIQSQGRSKLVPKGK